MADRGDLFSDISTGPLAARIAELSGLSLDQLSEGEADDLAIDVMRLEDAAQGWPLPGAHNDLETLRNLREHLESALTAAQSLPEYLGCKLVVDRLADAISEVDHRVNLAVRIASAEAGRIPKKRSAQRHEGAYRAADFAADIFRRRMGVEPTVKHKEKDPRSDFGRLIYDIFKILFPDLKTRPGWYGPAKSAVTPISQEK